MRIRIYNTGWQYMTTYLSESESETTFFFLGGAAGFFLGLGASSSESEFGCNKITTSIPATKYTSNTHPRQKVQYISSWRFGTQVFC
jgi:hypothetical protein